MKTVYVRWNSGKVMTWYPSVWPAAVEKVTSVHGYCFDGDKVLPAYIRGRGFEIPGGHMEEGESPEEALIAKFMRKGVFAERLIIWECSKSVMKKIPILTPTENIR